MNILIKNGRIIDPASNMDKEFDILIEGNIIKKISRDIEPPSDKKTNIIDASDCIVLPGLIDMHVHFREPGREDVETIIGGSEVAAKSGYTTVCTMPNTTPVIDNLALVRFIKLEAEKTPINVLPIANITKGSLGEEITEMGELVRCGAVGFSDDGMPVMKSILMRRALEYAKMTNAPIITHSEDLDLSDKGIMNEGYNSVLLGLKGIPKAAEEVMIARDVILARFTKGKLHIAHVSSAGSVDIIKKAKEEGVNVTCEATPHHFSLTDDAVRTHLSMAKMNPPLRTEIDRLAIIEGLRSGVIDAIVTDHAPHLNNEKMQELEYAPFGIIGLETAVPLVITKLIKEHKFSFIEAFKKLTINPAKILNIDAGELKENKTADIVIINPDKKVHIDNNFILSKCKNTPFIGQDLFGSVEYTICSGKIVYRNK
ncbi:MAG: dihydroorotase [Spirochaetota bacterium]